MGFAVAKKIEILAAYAETFRESGPMSAWRAGQLLGLSPQRSYLWVRALERLGLVERIIHRGRLGFRATRAGRDPRASLHIIGSRGAEPLKGTRAGPIPAATIKRAHAAAQELLRHLDNGEQRGQAE